MTAEHSLISGENDTPRALHIHFWTEQLDVQAVLLASHGPGRRNQFLSASLGLLVLLVPLLDPELHLFHHLSLVLFLLLNAYSFVDDDWW